MLPSGARVVRVDILAGALLEITVRDSLGGGAFSGAVDILAGAQFLIDYNVDLRRVAQVVTTLAPEADPLLFDRLADLTNCDRPATLQ